MSAGVADLIQQQRKLDRSLKADKAAGATFEQQLAHAREEATFARRQAAQAQEERKRSDETYRSLKERYDVLRRSLGGLDAPHPPHPQSRRRVTL